MSFIQSGNTISIVSPEFPEFKEYLTHEDHLMRVLVLSKKYLLLVPNLERNLI